MTNVQSEICNPKSLRVLIVEDSEDDALLLLNLLKRNGYEVTHERVEKEDAMRSALQEKPWDVILCDYKMPQFDGMRALKLVSDMGIDIPFIIVSGTIGEDIAVECMKAGAHDYIMKNKTQRFVPAVEREIREAAVRRGRKEIERELDNLAMVVKHSSELIYLAAPDGTLVFMNEAGRDKIGIPFDQVAHHRILDVFPSDYRESVKRVILPELMKSGSWQGDLQYCNIETGAVIDVYASFFTIKDTSTGTSLYIANVSTDISERKKTEKEIMHLASFPQFSPILILEIERGGAITYVNPATQRALAEMGETDAALFIPKDIHAVVREGRISEEKEITREVVLHGRTYTEKFCFLPVFDVINVYAYDITERKLAEEALQRSEEQYRNIFNDAILGIYQTTPEGRFLNLNPALTRMLGYNKPAELINSVDDLSIQIYANPEDRGIFREILLHEGVVEKFETQLRRKSGEIIWVSINAHVVKDTYGNIVCFEGTVENITERRRVEEAIRLSEERFRNLYQEGPIPAFTWQKRGEDFIFVDFNRAMIQVTNGKVSDYLGSSAVALYNDRPDILSNMELCCRKKSIVRREIVSRNFAPGKLFSVFYGFIPPDLIIVYTEDITDKKLMEDALKESEQKYRSIFENTIEGVFQSTVDGHFLTVNPAFARMHGYESPDEMVKAVTDIEKQLYADPVRRDEFTHILYEHGVITNFEHQQLKKNGGKIWVRINAREIKDDENNILYYEGTAEDITERKNAEEALRESEEHFRQLTEQSLMAVGIIQDGVFKYFNRKFEEISGYSADEIKGWKPFEFSHTFYPDDMNFVINQIKKKQAGYQDVVPHYYFRIIHKNGNIRWIEVYSKTVAYKNRPADMLTLIDITERKNTEKALRESEERYKTITEKTISGIYLIQDGLLRYVNPTFCNIYGYTRDELVDKLSPLDLVVKEEKEFLDDKIRQRLSGEKESDQFSIRIRRKDGEVRFLEVFSSYALYAGKPAVLGTCVDMTEARRANEAIKRSQKELRSLTAYLQNVREEERMRIAREIHDELGQSLTGIKIDISWLKKKLGDIVEPTDPIQTKIDSILALTESTIATTRELSLSLRPGILDDLGLAVAIKWQLKRFQEKVGIICMLQSDVAEITIPADYSTVLFRISQECLTNVSRHANATKVKITLTGEGKNLVLEIEDNGKGITKEQIKNPLSLGILGMRERIMGLKGRFSINGEPGKGTKVRVELPMK
ncbi:MAG: Oxygen sensor histidine kinase NreB [Syntrophorhabdus sp. PtaU1.Bin058]|nr:MAG: Oxygen sensor histidine kinase NreB [Syntrophorhabdus sp. PtaU1.Bin058]